MKNLGVLALTGIIPISIVVGCGTTVVTTEATTSPPAATEPEATPEAAPTIADELSIDEIAFFQGVKATLVSEGALVKKPNAPIIANRPAYVRVFVKALARTRPVLEAELRIKRAGKEDVVLKDGGKRPTPELDEEEPTSTFNFTVPAEAMTVDASFSFKAGPSLAGASVLTFPADGSAQSLDVKATSQRVRVKLVPVTYQAEVGTSLTPDLEDLTDYKQWIYRLYPTVDVEMSVREPIVWDKPIKSSGAGWSELLSGIMAERRKDKPERDVYYIGVFTPQATFDQFCPGGCVLGLAPQADELEVGLRAAIVLGYMNRSTSTTMAHELAHAMGRGHAPCGGPAGVDTDYPYGSGSIGVWGYDVVSKKLLNPSERYRDFMSYCGPSWVSDYTYRGLFERMDIVAQQQAALVAGSTGASGGASSSASAAMELRQSFRVDADGSVHEGPAIEVIPGEERGEIVPVTYEGALGKVFATAKGRVRHLSEDAAGSMIIAPAPPAGATHARVGARALPIQLQPRAFAR